MRRRLDGTFDEASRTRVVGAEDEAAARVAESAAALPRIGRCIPTPFRYGRERRDRLAGSGAPRLRDRFSPTPGR